MCAVFFWGLIHLIRITPTVPNFFLLPSFQCLGLWLHQQFNTCSLRCKCWSKWAQFRMWNVALMRAPSGRKNWLKKSKSSWIIFPNKGLKFVKFLSKVAFLATENGKILPGLSAFWLSRLSVTLIANHSLSLSQVSHHPSHLRHQHGHVGQHNEVRWWDTCWSDFRRWHRRHGGRKNSLLHKGLKFHSNLLLHYLPYHSPFERHETRK